MPDPTRSPDRRRAVRDVTHVVTAFRLRSAIQVLEEAPTPEAAANALLAYREHCSAIGVRA